VATPQPLRCTSKSGKSAQRSGHPLFLEPISNSGSEPPLFLAPAQQINRYAKSASRAAELFYVAFATN
jgi:hypothetical protein